MTRYIIRAASGVYFTHWTTIGPAFGEQVDAKRFDTYTEAVLETTRHYGFTTCTIIPVDDATNCVEVG